MKWMTLKVYLLPCIMQEIDKITEEYTKLVNNIRKIRDAKELNVLNSEFENLRESITQRIEEIEVFYEENIHDSRITNFEKARLRLKKLLMYDPDTLNKIDNTGIDNKHISLLSQRDFKKQTVTTNNNFNPNNFNNLKQDQKKSSTGSNSVALPVQENKIPQDSERILKEYCDNNNQENIASDRRVAEIKSKNKVDTSATQKSMTINDNKKFSKTNITTNTNNLNKQYPNNENNPQVVNKPGALGNENADNYLEFKDLAKWKEIVFKIKLTEAEYKLLIKEKANLVNLK